MADRFRLGFRQVDLLPTVTITAAAAGVLSTAVTDLLAMTALHVQAVFTYGSGGTSLTCYIQTSFDVGTTWFDIMCFAFTTASATRISSVRTATAVAANYTATDATLTDNTIKDGLLGDRVRVKYTSVGTYASTTLRIFGMAKGVY